jgi:hypothetical protein
MTDIVFVIKRRGYLRVVYQNKNSEMTSNQKNNSRRKFLWGGLGILSGISLLKFISPKKERSAATAKMLTEDGRLVEVDMEKIKRTGNKISDKEVITWVKNKPTIQ